MAASYDNTALALNLGGIVQRYREGATLKLSGGRDGEPVIVKFRSAQDTENLPNTDTHFVSDPTRRSRRRVTDGETDSATSSAQRGGDGKSAAALKLVIEEFGRQDRLGLACKGAFILPLMKVGQLEDCVYYVRRWLPSSLLQRVEEKVRIGSSKELFHIVHGIWSALCFLHQSRVGIPHGNLKLSNVLCDSQAEGTGHFYLTDPALLAEAGYAEGRVSDFQSLGLLISQLCACSSENLDLTQADRLTLQAKWSFLGEHESEWKTIARRLMANGTYLHHDFDALAAREEWLRPVSPGGFLFLPIPAPVAGTTSAVAGGVVDDEIGRLQSQVASGDWAGAIPALCKLLGEVRESSGGTRELELLDTLTRAVASIADEDSAEAAWNALVTAAPFSGAAAYRVGTRLIESDAPAAMSWLVRAIELNFMQAAVALGLLHMNGGNGLTANPGSAAKNFETAIKEVDSLEAKFWLAVLILRKTSPGKPERAVALLEEVAASPGSLGVNAHVLLGQCHALGLGTVQDHSLATHAFHLAYDQSRATGHPDGYAMNNLAVCLVHGLGVEQDVKLALDLLVQAAEAGCRGALNNQDRLPRRLFLH